MLGNLSVGPVLGLFHGQHLDDVGPDICRREREASTAVRRKRIDAGVNHRALVHKSADL